MKTILVDDERWAIQEFAAFCENNPDIDLLGTFTDPLEALDFAEDNPVELAFLDVEMPGMKGTELAQNLRSLYPQIIIIFVSAYDQYMRDAFNMNADYFITKPYSSDDMEQAVVRAKLLSGRFKKSMFVQCFGKFEVFVDGQALAGSTSKAIEVFAYLVDKRGTFATPQEIFNTLWADRVYNNYHSAAYRKALARLQEILKEANCSEVLLRETNGVAVNPQAFDCDYYQLIDGDDAGKRAFRGEYMTQYSWAKTTQEYLQKLAAE